METKRLFILIPRTGNSYPKRFVDSAFEFLSGYQQLELYQRYGIQTSVVVESTMPIDANRNKLIDIALEGKPFVDPEGNKKVLKADYALFVDTDQTFPLDTLTVLMSDLIEKDLDCVSGMYFLKKPKFDPIFGRYVEPTNTNFRYATYYPSQANGCKPRLFKVDVVGMGCFMFNMRIFEKVKFPFFRYGQNPNTKYQDASEDMFFCKKLKEAGVDIWIDPNIRCGHIGETVITEDDYIAYRSRFESALSARDKKLYWENIHDLRDENNEKTPMLIEDNEINDWLRNNLDKGTLA